MNCQRGAALPMGTIARSNFRFRSKEGLIRLEAVGDATSESFFCGDRTTSSSVSGDTCEALVDNADATSTAGVR